jgi:hypothetical protein
MRRFALGWALNLLHVTIHCDEVSSVESQADPSNYYTTVRLALLGALLLVGTHLCSLLYLRWAVGADSDDADGLPFLMCSIAQSVAWGQMLLLIVQLCGASSAVAPMHATLLQYCSSACLWVLTPFAYLYHEAVGIGSSLGTTGAAARAIEAGDVSATLRPCLPSPPHGSPPPDSPTSAALVRGSRGAGPAHSARARAGIRP